MRFVIVVSVVGLGMLMAVGCGARIDATPASITAALEQRVEEHDDACQRADGPDEVAEETERYRGDVFVWAADASACRSMMGMRCCCCGPGDVENERRRRGRGRPPPRRRRKRGRARSPARGVHGPQRRCPRACQATLTSAAKITDAPGVTGGVTVKMGLAAHTRSDNARSTRCSFFTRSEGPMKRIKIRCCG